MATSIDFPNTPTVDDEYTYGNITYVWDGTRWYPKPQPDNPQITVGTVAPSSPEVGDLWVDTN